MFVRPRMRRRTPSATHIRHIEGSREVDNGTIVELLLFSHIRGIVQQHGRQFDQGLSLPSAVYERAKFLLNESLYGPGKRS